MLTDREVRLALYCVREVITARRGAKQTVTDEMIQLRLKLGEYVTGSIGGTETGEMRTARAPLTQTAQQVADRLGITDRAVRKRGKELGGKRIAGVWLFPEEGGGER